MLEFVDRFADPRHLADPALRCAAIWIGTVPSEAALVDHLSPDDPAAGQFARDAGDAYDPDFLASEVTEPRPIKVVLAEIADRHGLTEAQLDDLVHRCETHGVTAANTTVVLGQHRFDGDADVAFHDLVFVGNVEYREPAEPVAAVRSAHLFAGITTAPTLADLRAFVHDGAFAQELGMALTHVVYYGYKLCDDTPLPPQDLFGLPIVRDRILLEDSLPAVERACQVHGVERINAFIAGTPVTDTSLSVAPDARFAGLHHLGTFPSSFPDQPVAG
ncbi:hypothetical protein [Microlunatus sp. Y2014]|uniref:hypothetical protein n=1 Tax=Microlunatus sp. Y2014 TaxID=3418488 RepID=UPI003DA6E13D